jgi:hypothetical protein
VAFIGSKTTAESFSSSTFCVVIGVGEYDDKALRPLPAAAREASEICRAITDETGIDIPATNVTALIGEEATHESICLALEGLAQRVTGKQRIFVYYAGHGISVGQGFGLCASNTHMDDADSIITSSWLQKTFSRCAAAGLLFILDCCGGAALAEDAPRLFGGLGEADYRILLSASRRLQSSWETDEGSLFTRFLLKALKGEDPVGPAAGRFFFNDLYTYLHDRVLEEREVRYPHLSLQEPTFAGSYLRDPLLFVHGKLSLSQLVVQTKRYSREYLRRLIMQSLAITAALLLLAVGLYWTLLDQLQYVQLTERGLVIRHGHPDFQGFGLPRDLWSYELSRDEVAATSPLANNKIVLSRMGESIADRIPEQLTLPGRARFEYLTGAEDQGLADLRMSLTRENDLDPAERIHAIELLSGFARDQDASLLGALIPRTQAPYQRDLARAFVRVGQGEALAALAAGEAGRGLASQAVSELTGPCSASRQAALSITAEQSLDFNDEAGFFYAAAITGCRLPASFLNKAQFDDQILLANYFLTIDSGGVPSIVETLTRQLEIHISKADAEQIDVPKIAHLLAQLPPGRCPHIPNLHTLDNRWRILDEIAIVVSRSCQGWRRRLTEGSPSKGERTYRLQLIQTAGGAPYDVRHLQLSGDTAEWIELMDSLDTAPIDNDESVLRELLSATADATVSRIAMIVLKTRRVSPPDQVKARFGTTYQPLAAVALVYWADRDRADTLRELTTRLTDPAADYVISAFAFLRPTVAEQTDIIRATTSQRVPAERRATLLAMFSPPHEAAAVLCAPDASTRSAAWDALPFRDDVSAVEAEFGRSQCSMPYVPRRFDQIEREQTELKSMLANGAAEFEWVRRSSALFYEPDHSQGLRYWLQRDCLYCL